LTKGREIDESHLSVGGLIPGAVGDALGAAPLLAPPDGAALFVTVFVAGTGTLELL